MSYIFFPPRIFFIKKKGTKPKHILQSISPQQQGKDRPNLIGPTAQPNQATPRRAGRLSFGPRVKERGHVLEFYISATRVSFARLDPSPLREAAGTSHRNPRYAGAQTRRASTETTFLQLSDLSAESFIDLIKISSALRESQATNLINPIQQQDHLLEPLEPATQDCVSLHPPETRPARRC